MLTGPQGQKRPADVVGCAVMVGKIATGEIEGLEVDQAKRKARVAGGLARNRSLIKEKRKEIAQKAVAGRWAK